MSDVWESRDGSGPDDDGFLGEPAYGEGLHPNQAFSVERVFSMGFAALQEQPALVILAGFNLFLMQVLPQLASYPVQGLIIAGQVAEALDPDVAEVLAQLSGPVLSLLFFPIVQLVTAGAMVGTARWIRNEQVSIVALYSSFAAGWRAMLTAIVSGIVTGIISVGLLLPGLGLLFWGVFNEQLALGLGVGGFLLLVGFIGVVWVGLGFMLAPYAAVLDELGPFDAVALSWRAASGARITLFVTTLVFNVIGILACCFFGVPFILVAGVGVAGYTGAWLLHARQLSETREWGFVQRNVRNLDA